ncbi:MAG: DUF5915 domain-containing protein, partial [Myxococcota bacterium]|nr:DUF5915 domain-containing protein [Myxococcota bacterium]
FYALLSMSAMMEQVPPFKTLLGHALVRDERGNEMHKSQGNAVWFDDAAEKMGVDVMRWLFCGHNPTSNLNFGYGEGDTVRRRVINTLWNVYAFLCNYARLDGFDPESERVPVAERPDIDRWLLSNLQILVRDAHHHYSNYSAAAVIRSAEKFIDELSNWYVRRNRRRFWRGADEGDRDKLAAYQTLYDALLTLLEVTAPMIPFVSDHMVRNLTPADGDRSPISVHLHAFPQVDEALLDEELSFSMDEVIKVVSQSLALRKSKDMRVRQPLARLVVVPADERVRAAIEQFSEVIAAELNVKAVEFLDSADGLLSYRVKPNFGLLGKRLGKATPLVAKALAGMDPVEVAAAQRDERPLTVAVDGTDYLVEAGEYALETVTPANLAVSETSTATLALDVELTDALRIEGVARDVVRHVQQLRKERDLEMEDRIHLRWDSTGDDLNAALADWANYVAAETLAVDVVKVDGLSGGAVKAIKLAGQILAIDLDRA